MGCIIPGLPSDTIFISSPVDHPFFIDHKNWAQARNIKIKVKKKKAISHIPGRPFSSNVNARYSEKTEGSHVLNPFFSFPLR
ncbi:hypothetical protein [uncultured Desulfuromusa sp.]|uniref:hypothetical protein n=1 Tax=uncultured Desulfuromusa sp. TaxID=219183 RepID=UPI002AA76D0E|nr:hypothetical protein [uncultured Desulfuromusa sp.]